MATNPRYANGHRRRTLRARLLATPHPICAECGEPIDKTLHHLDPGAPEVDEIIPISRGGSPLKRSNLRLLHRICNQRRGARLGPPAATPYAEPSQPITSRPW